jgi:hypothetical protein
VHQAIGFHEFHVIFSEAGGLQSLFDQLLENAVVYPREIVVARELPQFRAQHLCPGEYVLFVEIKDVIADKNIGLFVLNDLEKVAQQEVLVIVIVVREIVLYVNRRFFFEQLRVVPVDYEHVIGRSERAKI